MKYYYKLFVNEGVEVSLKSINATEYFINAINKSVSFNGQLEQHMTEFFVGYNVDIVRTGKIDDAWSWSTTKDHYRGDWKFKGDVHPQRKDKINKLKKLWENE